MIKLLIIMVPKHMVGGDGGGAQYYLHSPLVGEAGPSTTLTNNQWCSDGSHTGHTDNGSHRT